MNSRKLVVCDLDMEYGLKLADYLRRVEIGYEVELFTDPNIFYNDYSRVEISVLLVQEEFYYEIERISCSSEDELIIENKYILTEDRYKDISGCVCIFKYQSVKNIIEYLGDDIRNSHIISYETSEHLNRRIIGVYSPVNNCLKTTFSITYGQILAEKERVLYINLEGYSGLNSILELNYEHSLIDLLYEYSISPESINVQLNKYVERIGEVDFLATAYNPFELHEIDTSIWIAFISSIVQSGLYSVLILDISDVIKSVVDILFLCSEIYMPYRRDAMSMAKIDVFENNLLRYPSGEDLRSKIKKIRFPYFDDINYSINQIKHGKLGKYIREMLYEQGRGANSD